MQKRLYARVCLAVNHAMKRTTGVLTAVLATATSLEPAIGQQFYFSANCVSQIQLEEQCNINLMRQSLIAKFDRGTATNVKYANIDAWNYTDSSKAKIDTELAARIGIIGLLFKKAVHRHVFSINYKDDFGDRQSLIINFSDSQYALPMLSALRAKVAVDNEIK
jgi:hypothetical protein